MPDRSPSPPGRDAIHDRGQRRDNGVMGDTASADHREVSAEQAAAQVREEVREEVLREIRHDLRNPLHVVVGYVDPLSTCDLPEPARDYVEQLRAASDQLRALVERSGGAGPPV